MIEALRIHEICKKYNSPNVYKELVQHHCKKLHYQNVILPIDRKYERQKASLTLYLSEKKIMRGREQVNPVELVPVQEMRLADVYCTYWNRLHFFALPKGMKLAESRDPVNLNR